MCQVFIDEMMTVQWDLSLDLDIFMQDSTIFQRTTLLLFDLKQQQVEQSSTEIQHEIFLKKLKNIYLFHP